MKLVRFLLYFFIIAAPSVFAKNKIPLFTFEVVNDADVDIYYVYDAAPKNDINYQKLVVNAFHEEYKKYDPKLFKPSFEREKDVAEWLKKIWPAERQKQQESDSVKLLEVRHHRKLIAVLALDLNPTSINRSNLDDCKHKNIIQIRLVSLKKNKDRMSIFPPFIYATQKHFMPDCDVFIYDTRALNCLNMKLFKVILNFKAVCKPFDKDLYPQRRYVGLMKEINK